MAIQHYDYPNVKSVVICGDIHGEFEKLVYQCCVRYEMRDTLIIVAGDCGFGFKYPAYDIDFYYSRTMDRIIDANNYLAFVRGNHDNPLYFDGEHVGYERFHAVPDYSVLTACGHQILCIGGATSVDRIKRTASKDWWTDEQPVFDHDKLVALKYEGYQIDTVVAHCAPSFCENITPPDWVFQLADEDPSLLEDLKSDRMTMDNILKDLKTDRHPLRRWLYGHYHHSWQSTIEGVDYTMLGIMEMKELR